MKSLIFARQCARRLRETMGASSEGLTERVSRYLFETYGVELHAVHAAFLEGGQAEVSPAEGCLFYDASLDADPVQKLMVVLHELGHLALHPRLQRCCDAPDPVFGSMYINDGASALARYNYRSREEAEANAFATEFLCPSQEALRDWREHSHESSADMAQRWRIPVSVARAQLAEALYWQALETGATASEPMVNDAPSCDSSQLEAATAMGYPVLVHAGPGTGKTATLVYRITYLLDAGLAEPEQLFVLTFSNEAAEELRQRVASMVGEALATRLAISTFHGFGVAFLHHHGQFLGIEAQASVLDEAGQEELITHLIGTVDCEPIVRLSRPEETVREMVRHIGYLKDRLYLPDDFAQALADWQPSSEEVPQYMAAQVFLRMYRAYEDAKQAQQCLDFADLIALPIRILLAHPALRQAYRDKYQWVMVDEYQDVSRAVACLLRQLCGPDNPPWVVGDVHQAIYRFRGAAPENVEQFHDDFPGAQQFNLDTNYRSSEAIVAAANQLASMMAASGVDRDGAVLTNRWNVGATGPAGTAPSVVMASASSDAAEQEGIASQIETWLSAGVLVQDIAVLARRNIDVRNIALSLGKRGIRARTAGLMTPEGAAGDLAAVTTLVDQPRASLPRLAVAIGRDRFRVPVLNEVIRQVLRTCDGGNLLSGAGETEHQRLAGDVQRAYKALYAERFHGDAFTMMCVFLFDGSDYLRRLLDQPPGAERSLSLSEIITSLAKAASYRFLHPDTVPRLSRVGFAHMFRAALGASLPSLMPPSPAPGTVRVMTCHAAKGLEFPYVIVAGQTLSQASRGYPWLPPSLWLAEQDERKQADALLFVGATRAKRALVITYASSAGGTARSRARQMTPLLEQWYAAYAVPTCNWTATAPESQRIRMGAVWGGTPDGMLPARALDKNACPLRTYLEHDLGVRFPLRMQPLYPTFFGTLRRAMGDIVHLVHDRQAAISPQEAKRMFIERWPASEVADHPHRQLYFSIALEYIERFARAYQPEPRACQHLDLVVESEETGRTLRHDLLALYRIEDGTAVAVSFRPETLADKTRPTGLLWSGLTSAQRVSFVILKQNEPGLHPQVFSAQDGVVYPYAWPRRQQDFDEEAGAVAAQLHALSQQRFDVAVQTWTCERCPVRISCPHWLEL